MSDFIRKTELIETLDKLLEEYEGAMTTPSFFAALSAVRGAETVDAAEVIRCKNCAFSALSSEKKRYCFCNISSQNLALVVDDDFCSCGERRDVE